MAKPAAGWEKSTLPAAPACQRTMSKHCSGKAAQDGNAYGMNNLGAMFEKGRGGLKRDEAHVEGLVS